MYKKIMVPLDGSDLAETVLPHVEAFIKGFGLTDVALVRVLTFDTKSTGVEGYINSDEMRKIEEESISSALSYLDRVADRLRNEGATLHSEVLVGRVTENLVDYAASKKFDLIIIATHGRSGVTRWVMGSVAERVLRSANTPVLMVQVHGRKK